MGRRVEGGRTTAAVMASWGFVFDACAVVGEDSSVGSSPSTAAGAVILCSVVAAATLVALDGPLSSLLLTRYSSRRSGTRPVE